MGVDNFETGRESNWPAVSLDICDRSTLYDLANDFKPRLVIHCAASYKDPLKWHRDTDVNVAGAINVAAVAKHHNARIIYFQTVLPPISSYAISKIAGEHYLRLSGQPLTVYRLASVYGPRNLSGPIPTFYRRIKAGETCTVVRDVTRDFVFIEDLVERVLQGTETGVVDVRSGTETAIQDLPGMIGDVLGAEPACNLIDKPVDDVPHYEMNGVPRVGTPMATGIARTVAWYEEHGVEDTYTHLTLEGR
jgi:UDP-glucose 4-epimerase